MRGRRQNLIGTIVFLTPVIIIFLMWFVYPTLFLAVSSFFRFDAAIPMKYCGLRNYIDIFHEEKFYMAIKNLLVWILAILILHIPLSIFVSLVLSHKPIAWKFFRTAYFFPTVISTMAVAICWYYLYNPQLGPLSSIMRSLGFKNFNVDWLGSYNTSLYSVIAVTVFSVGFNMVIYLAYMGNISKELYESARIDGATEMQRDLYITVPLMKEIIGVTVLFSMNGCVRMFDLPYLMTKGGPGNENMTLTILIFNNISDNFYGYANAVGALMLLVGIFVVTAHRVVFRKKGGGE